MTPPSSTPRNAACRAADGRFGTPRRRLFAALAVGLFAALPLAAQAQWERRSFWHEGWVAGGRLDAVSDPGPGIDSLRDQRSRYAFAVGGAVRIGPYTLLDLEAPFIGQKFATPPGLATADDLVSVKTRGVAAGFRQIAPVGPFELYAGLGVGWYESVLSAADGSGHEDEFVDASAGGHVSAGINLALGPYVAVGLEARRLWLEADFGTATAGLVEIGGRQVLFTLRFRER